MTALIKQGSLAWSGLKIVKKDDKGQHLTAMPLDQSSNSAASAARTQ